MTPLTDGEAAILSQLANIAATQADTSQRQAVNTERLTGIAVALDAHLHRADDAREAAVSDLKVHVTTTLAIVTEKARADDRKLAIFCTALVIVAELTKVGAERFWPH